MEAVNSIAHVYGPPKRSSALTKNHHRGPKASTTTLRIPCGTGLWRLKCYRDCTNPFGSFCVEDAQTFQNPLIRNIP